MSRKKILLLIMAILTILILAIVIVYLVSNQNQKDVSGPNNENWSKTNLSTTPTITPILPKNISEKKLDITLGNCAYGDNYTLGIGLINMENIAKKIIININGQISIYNLSKKEHKSVQAKIGTKYDGEKILNIIIYANNELMFNKTITTHCSSSSGENKKNADTNLPTVTATIEPTSTITATPITTVSPPNVEVDEFPNVLLPALAVLGLFLFFGNKKRK